LFLQLFRLLIVSAAVKVRTLAATSRSSARN
jgi:hypothetical protein